MNGIRFYNSLAHRLEPFELIDPPQVYMYNCGPTVYDHAHIGNFKTFLFCDVLRRFLELVGYQVHQVMNITDVGHMTEDQLADGGGEDKMQLAARRIKEAKKQGQAHLETLDNPDDPYQVAAFYTQRFLEDARALALKVADEYPGNMPKASDHIPQMQDIISTLIARGHAYVAGDNTVYYSVKSFEAYGQLSGNTIDKLRGGAGGRLLDEHQDGKRHPADFLLWKNDATHLMKWDSPWGVGYPGWHLECSAMASHVLGRTTIDIHTGGEDNIFPHHECEIAQSCAAFGNDTFARFWMHSRHLKVEGQKMSKSKGTFFTVRDLMAKGIDPAVIRFELIKSHYRSNTNFTYRGLEDSAKNVRRLRDFYQNLLSDLHNHYSGNTGKMNDEADQVTKDHSVVKEFIAALSDDLNISHALSIVFQWMKDDPETSTDTLGIFDRFNEVLGIIDRARDEMTGGTSVSLGAPRSQSDTVSESFSSEAQDKCEAIDQARAEKNYVAADDIRQQLIATGYDVKTTKEGTVAIKKLM